MLKTLQLYTVCIVVLVIVLSQITIFSEYIPTNTKSGQDKPKQHKAVSQKDDDFFENIKKSKYGEPLRELDNVFGSIINSKEKLDNSIGDLTNILDIEKNINDLYDFIDE